MEKHNNHQHINPRLLAGDRANKGWSNEFHRFQLHNSTISICYHLYSGVRL